jgi:tetratricopeptide (TPR) repeat protein
MNRDVRVALRILSVLLALPLLAVAGLGAAAHAKYGPDGFRSMRDELFRSAQQKQIAPQAQLDALRASLDQATGAIDPLASRPVHGGIGGIGVALLVFAAWPARRKRADSKANSEESAENLDTFGSLEDVEAAHSKKASRKHRKVAAQMLDDEGPEAAASYLLDHGLKDEAVETFLEAELFDRAAEVRHDQNRFQEAAELHRRAGKHEAAGAIYAQLEAYDEAADCYKAAEKHSVAGEMYERAENFGEAGCCYSEIGFHRHAAQSFLKAGRDQEAAESLVAAFTEEGGGNQQVNENKAKELKALARKAGELLCKLERFDEAENILVRAGDFGRAAKVAYQTGAYERASELFLRVGRGDLAAKALTRAGKEVDAAKHLGEYLREKGEEAEAIGHLAKAGDFLGAADLCRKLGRYEDAAGNYAQANEFPAAAEMYRAAGLMERAADAYEQCNQFEAAAGCLAEGGDVGRRAELLEKAGCMFEAGQLWQEQGQEDEAIRLLQQVPSDHERYAEACSKLGALFKDKGMVTLSFKKLDEVAGQFGVRRDNVDAFYQLAVELESRSDWVRAADLYEKILSFDYHYHDVAQRQENAKQQLEAAQTAAATLTQAPQTAPINPQVNRYEIVRELGRGGMGVVYLARDSVLERDVAYKVLPEGLRNNPNALKNFLREAKAAAQLNHPNIVTVYDAGESEHGFYLAMEFVEGTTLKEVLRHRGPVAPGGVIYILRQMAEALAYAHGKRVVHRDIKTANTMWTTDKKVKIMDFGLAKLMEEVRNATTMISGTPFYMSPEQTLGRNVDHRTDIYSLGVTLFELATGELPFRKGNVPYHHVHTAPPDPREIRADLPPALAALILKCLEKDPDARYQSAQELVEQIDRLSGQGS